MRNSKRQNIVLVVVCALLLGIVVKGLDVALYPCTFMRNDIYTMTSTQKDVLILGTSNGKMDLDPDAMLEGTELSGHNLCVGGEYPIDAYYLVKLAIEKQHPKQIIFELDPGYFTTEKEFGNNYLLFYHEFPLSISKAEYYWDTMLDCDFRSTFFPFYEYPLSYEISKAGETIHQKLTDNYDISYLKGAVQEYHANGFIEKYPVDVSQFPTYTPVLFDEKQVKKENMEYMDKLIQLCKDNDIEFIATIMPLPAVTLVQAQDSYSEAWTYYAAYFANKDVSYYNFNTEYYGAYSHESDKYVDYDGHMNGDSAREFSKIFGEIVEKRE